AGAKPSYVSKTNMMSIMCIEEVTPDEVGDSREVEGLPPLKPLPRRDIHHGPVYGALSSLSTTSP
ncbi:MAG: hypothetical protein PHT97_02775, partial [Methanoculleus sp.]|uniref:hypothetical protein n=1 Tax=Methanoculleus sp. TaxID=90427 RepID=UPI002634F21D